MSRRIHLSFHAAAGALLLALGTAPSASAQSDTPSVYVEEEASEGSGEGFGAFLRVALGKRKAPVRLVADGDSADYRLKWSLGKGGGNLLERAVASAAAELVDRCGKVAWAESAGGNPLNVKALANPFGGTGPRKVAARLAGSLAKALKQGKVAAPAAACD